MKTALETRIATGTRPSKCEPSPHAQPDVPLCVLDDLNVLLPGTSECGRSTHTCTPWPTAKHQEPVLLKDTHEWSHRTTLAMWDKLGRLLSGWYRNHSCTYETRSHAHLLHIHSQVPWPQARLPGRVFAFHRRPALRPHWRVYRARACLGAGFWHRAHRASLASAVQLFRRAMHHVHGMRNNGCPYRGRWSAGHCARHTIGRGPRMTSKRRTLATFPSCLGSRGHACPSKV